MTPLITLLIGLLVGIYARELCTVRPTRAQKAALRERDKMLSKTPRGKEVEGWE